MPRASGYLCIDEVQDGPHCVFYAVDPILNLRIAYQISARASKRECLRFLRDLAALPLTVRGVTTDGLGLYRHTVQGVFGPVPHQVCLFHVLRAINEGVLHILAAVRRSLPVPPPRPRRGRPRRGEVRPAEAGHRTFKEALWHHRFAWVCKRPTAAQRRFIRRVGRRFPLLAALRSQVDRVYRLFDRRCRQATARRRLQRLRRDPRWARFPPLEPLRRTLASVNVEKALTFLDDPLLPATNNAVERENRRHRKRQRPIYRARTPHTLAARIRYSMVQDLRREPLARLIPPHPGPLRQTG